MNNSVYIVIAKHIKQCISDLGDVYDFAKFSNVPNSVCFAISSAISVLRSVLYISNIHRSDIQKDF